MEPQNNPIEPNKKSKKWLWWVIPTGIVLTAGLTVLALILWPKEVQAPAPENSQTSQQNPTTPAEQLLATMTLEEKIGQMFVVSTSILETSQRALDDSTAITDTQTQNLAKYLPGGIIFFADNIESATQTANYIAELQANTKYPLLIATDQEGGIVDRLKNASITHYPNMADIGATNDPSKAYEIGTTYGKEMRALGFNLDFAPVADVNTNPNNPVIGVRSFGSNPNLVANMVANEVKGLQQNNVAATLKHFPGHGDTSTDTHTGLATVQSGLNRLRQVELIPFKSGIATGVDLVLTAHIQLPNVDASNVPATMSKIIVTDLLRNELGFNGIIITDALDMGAIANYYSTTEVVTNCIAAGIDILLMPANYFDAYNTLLQLVQDGTIPESRIDASVLRILNLKFKYQIISQD